MANIDLKHVELDSDATSDTPSQETICSCGLKGKLLPPGHRAFGL